MASSSGLRRVPVRGVVGVDLGVIGNTFDPQCSDEWALNVQRTQERFRSQFGVSNGSHSDWDRFEYVDTVTVISAGEVGVKQAVAT